MCIMPRLHLAETESKLKHIEACFKPTTLNTYAKNFIIQNEKLI